mmetsp:Transcript_12380/g.16155  ORF Transcript_12380/g.16155 Transcript_12380/m.16155 type:complete len:101 (+) Transcript_12380:202-504(+)
MLMTYKNNFLSQYHFHKCYNVRKYARESVNAKSHVSTSLRVSFSMRGNTRKEFAVPKVNQEICLKGLSIYIEHRFVRKMEGVSVSKYETEFSRCPSHCCY